MKRINFFVIALIVFRATVFAQDHQEFMKPLPVNNFFGYNSHFDNWKDNYHPGQRMNPGTTARQRLDSAIILDLNMDEYVPFIKVRFTYNEAGHNTTETESAWVGDSSRWFDILKMEYDYNPDGTISGIVADLYVDSTGQWVHDSKVDYTYNPSGDRTLLLIYHWNDSIAQWNEFSRGEFIYGSPGKLSEEYGYTWNDTSAAWINDFKYTFDYDSFGNLSTRVYFHWSEIAGEWITDSKNGYAFDVGNNLIQDLQYAWSFNYWYENYRQDDFYDSLGNFSLNMQYYYDGLTWVKNARFEYSYNNDLSLDDLQLPDYMYADGSAEWFFRHQELESDCYIMENLNGIWYLRQKELLYYSECNTAGIREESKMDIAIYPNPANDCFRIKSKEDYSDLLLIIYDLQGKTVLEKEFSSNHDISAGNLRSGLYIYRIMADDKVRTGKILVQK